MLRNSLAGWLLALLWATVLTTAAIAPVAVGEPGTEDRLVFVNGRDASTEGNYGLSSIGVRAGDIRKLTDSPDSSDYFPKASHDGTTVVFERHYGKPGGPGDIWMVNADGSGLRQLTSTPLPDEALPALSPDGRRLAYYNRHTALVEIVDLDGTRRIQFDHDDFFSAFPEWSPDGRRIVYSACGWEIEPVTLACGLRIADSDGTAPPVARTNHVMDYQGYSACMFVQSRLPIQERESYFCHLAYRNDWAASWSPDGQELVFYRSQAHDTDLYAVDVDEGDPRPLNPDPAYDGFYNDRFPDWSPDGRSVVFARTANHWRVGRDLYDHRGIYVMSADGSGARQITRPVLYFADWQAVWTVAPTPSTPPAATPAISAAPAAGGAPRSSTGTVALLSRALRLSRRGTADVRLRCLSPKPLRCRGHIELWAGRRRLGLRSYAARPGLHASFGVRVSAAGRRMLSRRGRLAIRIVVTEGRSNIERRGTLRPAVRATQSLAPCPPGCSR